MSISMFRNFASLHRPVLGCLSISPISIKNERLKSKVANPKFRKERAKKVIKVQLPDYDEQRREMKMSVEEMRAKLKEKGIAPSREWNERPIFIGCTEMIEDPYIPPEGDGKISVISGPGVKQVYDAIGNKGKSYLALRKIRNIDYDFDVPTLAQKAQEIYVEAQQALAANDEEKLHDLVTEKAFPEMIESVNKKTIVWKLIQTLEPSRIVHIRVKEAMSKGSLFAQVTVRLHTQQTLAVYDRFGRLMHGSEDTVKDVLEYIVFEKYITLPHGTWRIHGKIIPDWMPPREKIKKTFPMPNIEKEFPEPPKQIIEEPKISSDSSLTPATV